MISFKRNFQYPVINSRKMRNSFFRDHAANSTIVKFGNNYLMYFRGINGGSPSTVGVWSSPINNFDGFTWNTSPTTNPILSAGSSGSFDATGVFDPVAVVFNNKVYLYYMGNSSSSSIGLATSTDGLSFTKQGVVVTGGGSPIAVVDTSNVLHLYYTKGSSTDGWSYYHRSSTDGTTFGQESLVFSPSKVSGSFDQMSVITGRIFYKSPYYYLAYSGSSTHDDYPEGIGLARSSDLLTWERYEGNPVLLRNSCGTWDEGGIWSPDIIEYNGQFFMWFEGVGTNSTAGGSISNTARDTQYGGYDTNAFSQIFTAIMSPSSNLSEWTSNISGNYKIKNSLTGKYLYINSDGKLSNSSNNSSKFTLNKKSNGFYDIIGSDGVNKASSENNSRSYGSYIKFVASSTDQSQDWYLTEVSKGFYQITNRYSGMVLSPENGSVSSGSLITQKTFTGFPNQVWELIPY